MRPTVNQIRDILKNVIKNKPAGGSFFAWLGRSDGTVIANDNNGVYIIDFNGNVQIVLNTKVPLYPFRLVEVGYISESSKILEVKRLVDAYPDNRPTALPNHEKHHEWGGVDTLWVRPEQIMVGLCIPDDTDPMTVQFIGFVFYLNGFHLINNFSLDMTAYVPTTGAAWVLLQTDESGNVTTVTGTTKDNWQLLEYEDIPEPEAGNKPLVAIRLYDGQVQIWKTKARSDIVDLRWSGYSVGGGGAVETVTGDGVDNTDPTNPVISYPTPADIGADLAGAAATAETNAKAYADGLVVGLWDDRGSYDASSGAYPSSGGSGTAGAILKGDVWTISVAGTLPTGQVVEVGDVVRALVDTPGNTQANWAITQNNIGYVAENSANKATSMTGNETSNVLYLTAKAIYDWATGLFVQKNAGITGATKTKITYDTKGLVTAGADLSSSDIPNLDASKITSGTIDVARLGSGTANSSKRLSGANVWEDAPAAEVLTENIFRCSPGGVESKWVGTISSKSGANIVVTTTSGNLACLVAFSTGAYAKIRLFNSTRGDYALVSQAVTATNTITMTANVPSGWVAGDTVTTVSTTVNSGDGRNWMELEIASGITKSHIFLEANFNASASSTQIGVAPVESFSFAKAFFLTQQVANLSLIICEPLAVNGAVSVTWQTNTTNVILKYKGFLR